MKFILSLVFLVFCFQANASWVCKNHIDGDPGWRAHGKKAPCLNACTGECYDVTGKDLRREKLGLVDNLKSPKFSKHDVSACSGPENCATNIEGKDCSAHGVDAFPVINADYSEAYCAKPNGLFAQMTGWVMDPAMVAVADAEDAAKALKKAESDAIAVVEKRMKCGRKVLAGVSILNKAKALTRAEKKTMLSTYAAVKGFLEMGSLQEARDEVDAATPDGTIVTAADKTAVLAKIDACLGI